MFQSPLKIKYAGTHDRQLWDGYVRGQPQAGFVHMFGWREIIYKAYGHATYYLMAYEGNNDTAQSGSERPGYPTAKILGVLPLVHLKHVIFGNHLISLPFLDGGGIIANCNAAAQGLLKEAIKLCRELGATRIEMRQEQPLSCWNEISAHCIESSGEPLQTGISTRKVRLLLTLPESSEMLRKSFKSKLRNQIDKPLKEGLTSRTGGVELLEDFYRVFSANMGDLGSPVHSIKLMHEVIREFSEQSNVFAVYKGNKPVAAGLVVGFDKMLANPWASSLRKYKSLSPNMLLYLRMLEYACDHGYQVFDFGRSSPGEGTYRFKEQWGATPAPLYWHYISLDGKPLTLEPGKGGFEKAIRYWQMLPLPITKFIGPRIRKYISL